jgi:hypothetical protein
VPTTRSTLFFLKSDATPLREPANDALLPRHHLREIEPHVGDDDAVRGEPVARFREVLARSRSALLGMQPTLRHVPPSVSYFSTQACACRAARRESPPYSRRARPDDDEIEALAGHQTSSRRRAGSSKRSFTRTRKVTACAPSTMR